MHWLPLQLMISCLSSRLIRVSMRSRFFSLCRGCFPKPCLNAEQIFCA